MSSTSTTQYYGLTQYVGSDKPSFLDNNEAFAAVDAALHGAVTDVASQGETISGLSSAVGTLGETVTGLSNDLNTEKGKIVALQNKEELQDAAIAGVKTAALDMICAYTEASATSTHAYAIGDYFRYQDVLYQATSAIEIGDTIVPNVNCSATNVTEEIDKVLADIPTTAADVPLAAITGMTADDVQEGIAELKFDLEDSSSGNLTLEAGFTLASGGSASYYKRNNRCTLTLNGIIGANAGSNQVLVDNIDTAKIQTFVTTLASTGDPNGALYVSGSKLYVNLPTAGTFYGSIAYEC